MATCVYFADDLEAAKQWYTKLLGIEPYFNRPPYIEFRIGDYQDELGILDRKFSPAEGGRDPRPDPAGATVYWHVDDAQAAVDRLISLGATLLEAPRDFGEGFIGASVIDPFGNILAVMRNPHYQEIMAQVKGT